MQRAWSCTFHHFTGTGHLLRISASVLIVALLLTSMPSHSQELLFPRAETRRDQHSGFPVLLLKEALKKAGNSTYTLHPTEFAVGQAHAFELLRHGRIQIMWSGYSDDMKNTFRMISTPILLGYMGWRVMLVPGANEQALRDVTSLEQLKRFPLLSGKGWPEATLYARAGFQVVQERDYDTLFERLHDTPGVLFPRAVLQVRQEWANRAHQDVAIEPYVLLKFPYTLHYYLPRREEALAQVIEKGLARLTETKEHDALLTTYYGNELKTLKLNARRVITMPLQ